MNATKETGEPNHGGNVGGKSVWWKWTAPASGEVTLSTSGSAFSTLIGVYTGTSVSALTSANGTSAPNSFTFMATANVTYRLAVDGLNGASGAIQLSLLLTIPPAIATWNFDAPPYSNPLPASSGNGTIDFSGWGGSVTDFTGVTGQALGLQGTAGNGTYIEVGFSMTGYSGLSITFSTRGTATGYDTGTWSWSANGGPFTTLPGVNTATTSTSFAARTVDFTGISALNNATGVRLRYTLSGATGSLPNNRIDDLVLKATAVQTVTATATNPDAYEHNGQSGSLTINTSLPAGAGGLAVQFQRGGTATPPGVFGADYSLSGNFGATTVIIPAGSTSATLILTPLADNDPAEFDETATITVQPSASYFVGVSNAATVTIHDDTPYNSTWASQFPTFAGANAAPNLDLDSDGISNFGEFVFNGNPFQSDRSILPVTGTIDLPDPNDGDVIKRYPTITFRHRNDAPNLIYTPESSTDLRFWGKAVQYLATVPGPGPNVDTITYRGIFPITGNGAVFPFFLRVEVSVGE